MRALFKFFSLFLFLSTFANAQIANHVVISEVYGGGGNSGATLKNDFVELYNPTSSSVNLNGWSVQYASATGSSWQVTNLTGSIPANGFFLVQEALGAGGTQNLPTPDATGSIAMSASNGKIALVNSSAALSGSAPTDGSIVDMVGFGTAGAFEGSGAAPAPGNTSSVERKAQSTSTAASLGSGADVNLGNGFDSNDNANDFVAQTAINPQNTSSPAEIPPGGSSGGGSDTNPPNVLSVKVLSTVQLEVTFNEAVDSVSSSNPSNYSLDKSITINGAGRNPSNIAKVTLSISTLATDSYTLTVQSVKDTAGNVMPSPQMVSFSYGTLTIAQARAAGAGQLVRVRGIITVANQFGSPSYMQDTTAGLAVYSTAFSSSVKVGDIWEVAGTLKDFNGLLEMDPISDTLKISSGNPLPTPTIVKSTDLNESYEGRLVRVNNLKFEAEGSFAASTNYNADDAFGTAAIRIVSATGIGLSPIPTDSVNVVGVLGEYNGIYQLMPRSLSDIGVIDPPPGQTWMDILTARGQPEGSSVTIRGIVTFAQPSAGTARTIYIQDATGGIASYHPMTDALLAGDSVEVRGDLSPYNNFLELNPVDSVALYAQGLALPQPKLISIPTASESFESQLVEINEVQFVETGTFADGTSGANYHVTDGSSQMIIRIPKNSELTGNAIPIGALNVVGVLAQFGAAYQLTPRSMSDLVALPGPQIVGPPVISALNDVSFTVNWTSLLNGNSVLYYGATQALGDSLVDQTQTTNHSFSVSGLTSGRVYYFRAFTANSSGTSSSPLTPVVTTSSGSSGEMDVYFNYPTDGTLGLTPPANGSTALLGKLLTRISSATKSIDLALYSFDDFSGDAAVVSNRVADSLLSAKSRGVDIRMVFDDKSTTAPLGRLIAGGISVIKRAVPGTDNGIMHNKFMIFDGRDTTSAVDDWVITGSWNVTNDGTVEDAQNAVFIQDQSLARIYELEFEEMFGSSTNTGNSALARFGPTKQDNTPHLTYVGGTKVEVYFSPSDQTTSHIINALSTADKSILFGILSFTRTDIADVLIAKNNAGVSVHGLIDQQPSVLGTLQAAGVDALQAGHSVVTGLFHHKYAVVDAASDFSDPIVITGSHNWSTAAETDNDENTLIIHSGVIARQYVQEFSQRYHESGGVGPVLSVEKANAARPVAFSLSQNYPNPFNPTTNFELTIARYGFVSMKVFDLLGRAVATLVNENMAPGVYTVTWDASKLASGIYLYSMRAGGLVITRKMLLVR